MYVAGFDNECISLSYACNSVWCLDRGHIAGPSVKDVPIDGYGK